MNIDILTCIVGILFVLVGMSLSASSIRFKMLESRIASLEKLEAGLRSTGHSLTPSEEAFYGINRP